MTDEQIDEVLKGIEWSGEFTHSKPVKGGQHCGMPKVVRLSHPELGITIECSYFRSQMENREAALGMIKSFLQTK